MATPLKTAPKPAAAAPATPAFRPVYGRMLHPFTGTEFPVGDATEHALDSWVESQVAAGKLVKA